MAGIELNDTLVPLLYVVWLELFELFTQLRKVLITATLALAEVAVVVPAQSAVASPNGLYTVKPTTPAAVIADSGRPRAS
jgi:hypothetical protein